MSEKALQVQPEGPFVLLGYSVGGNLAFEVAQALEVNGHVVSDILMIYSKRKTDIIKQDFADIYEETANILIRRAEQGDYEDYLRSDSLRETVVQRVASYTAYENGLVNSGVTAANMHVVRSPFSAAFHATWNGATTGVIRDYEGFGVNTS